MAERLFVVCRECRYASGNEVLGAFTDWRQAERWALTQDTDDFYELTITEVFVDEQRGVEFPRRSEWVSIDAPCNFEPATERRRIDVGACWRPRDGRIPCRRVPIDCANYKVGDKFGRGLTVVAVGPKPPLPDADRDSVAALCACVDWVEVEGDPSAWQHHEGPVGVAA